MYLTGTITTILLLLQNLQSCRAQEESCPACNALTTLWNPGTNTGTCLTSLSEPVSYILNFEQCICNTTTQTTYSSCVSCNLTSTPGVPIEGLDFGSLQGFQSACEIFAKDVTSTLIPSGLNAFASVVQPIMTAGTEQRSSMDILGFYVFQNVATATGMAVGGLVTDTASAVEYTPVVAMSTPTPTSLATSTSSGTTTGRALVTEGVSFAVRTGHNYGGGRLIAVCGVIVLVLSAAICL